MKEIDRDKLGKLIGEWIDEGYSVSDIVGVLEISKFALLNALTNKNDKLFRVIK